MKEHNMIDFWKTNWILILMIITTSCIKPTVFGSYIEQMPKPDPNITRVFIDRDGSIYPSGLIKIEDNLLKNDQKVLIDNVPTVLDRGYLHSYFNYSRKEYYEQLNQYYNIPKQENKSQGWASLQYAMLEQISSQLNKNLAKQSTAGGSNATLVVLIHGYNVNQKAGENYEPYMVLEKRVKENYFADKPVHFLEVYWDGLNGNIFTIWPYAQANAVFVGLSLRNILNQISKDYPIRIITHSTGAVVATNALWNVRAAKGTKGDEMARWQFLKEGENDATNLCFGEMRLDAKNYKTPQHPDLRLASIAPAQPGLTYYDFLDRTPADPDSVGWYQRIIIGYNNNDFTTSKGLRFLAKSKAGLGATSLAVYATEYGNYVYPKIQKSNNNYKTRSYWIDLYPNRFFYTRHGLIKYLEQPATADLLNLLFQSDNKDSTPPKKGNEITLAPYINCPDCNCNY
ncbi:hypothetical protein WG947_07280 [Pontibacter sp. H259]|uniref:hypothetical protein n=1 Tax=Pontibacter sp. H259 TaxID=3133421 RepID=UPI0030C2B095